MEGYWYCASCDSEVLESEISCDEYHLTCGTKVTWIQRKED